MHSRKLMLLLGLSGAFSILFAFNVNAGEAQLDTSTVTETTYSSLINGATEPGKIPEHVKYGMFVKRYMIDIRDHLILQLPPKDDSILQALVTQDTEKEHVEGLKYQAGMSRLCRNRMIQDAVSLAREQERVVKEYFAARTRRYRAAFDALSPTGRGIVDSFIETTIVPGSQTTTLNMVEWAKQDPAGYLDNLAIDCHVTETGELPPGVQKKIDELRRQMGVDDSVDK